ncbi:MAG TPA: hypothetical protein VM901_01435 [Bdellovibrionota bacterium]|jgi:hypothetical protein|nr:hypothetical protein [Bdellovibrionota bacterium]
MNKWFHRILTGLAFSTTVVPAISGAAAGVKTGHADMLDGADRVPGQERGGIGSSGFEEGMLRSGGVGRLDYETYDYEVIRLWAMMGL